MDKDKFEKIFSQSIKEVIDSSEEPIEDISDTLQELIYPEGRSMNSEESEIFDRKITNIIQTIVSLSVSSYMNFSKKMEIAELEEKLSRDSKNVDTQASSLRVLKDPD